MPFNIKLKLTKKMNQIYQNHHKVAAKIFTIIFR